MIGNINILVGRVIAWLSLLLVLVTVLDVSLRYFFSAGSVAVQELEWHIFSFLFLLTAGYTQAKDAHVRVDVLYSRFPRKLKAAVDFLGTLVFLVPFCILIIWTSIPFVESAYMHGEGSPDPGGLPYRFVVRSAVPLGFCLLLLQALVDLARNGNILFRRGSHSPPNSDSSGIADV